MSPWNCPFSTFIFDFYSIAHYITTSLFSKGLFTWRWGTPGALSIYEKNPEISVVAKVEFPIGKKLFHLVVNPGTWRGARPWTWNWYKLRET